MNSMKRYSVKNDTTEGRVLLSAQADRHLAREAALGNSAGMLKLRQLKRRGLITLSTSPHRKDDPDPHIGKCPDSNGVAFAFRSFALIVVFRPRFTLGTLPRKLMQGIAQWFDAPQSTMRFGIHATLIEDRRGSSQGLQTACILIPLSIIANLSQQPWSQVLPSTRQTLKKGVILMGQKKGADLFVIVGNLGKKWQQLADQGQHQARFGAGKNPIGLQLRLLQQFDNRSGRISRMGMPCLFELLLNLRKRCSSCSLNGWVGLQKPQCTLLLQFREQIQGHRIISLEASRELIDQTRLRADQRILITGQLLEFCHLVTIWGQPMQISEIGTPSFGEQVGIDQIRL